MRDEQELCACRRGLFDSFPPAGTALEVGLYQENLSSEILATEREMESDDSWERKRHLHLVRIYGDALAHTQLSVHAIRQLARNTGKPPHLSGQGKAFELAIDCLAAISEQGVPSLLADLTHVLKNADVIACLDVDSPMMIECKLSKVKDVRFEQQGRRGRQRARVESIGSFLRTGRGRIFGEKEERISVELTSKSDFDYRHVGRILALALEHAPTTIVLSDHEVLSAAVLGERADTSMIKDWARRTHRFAVGSSLERLEDPAPDVIPPILWDLGPEIRWALMEGNVSVTHVLSLNAFVGLEADDIRVTRVVDCVGPQSWGYEVLVGAETLIISPRRLVADVIYNHQTVASAGVQLLESAAKAFAVSGGVV